MPKIPSPDKKIPTRIRRAKRVFRQAPASVSDLLQRRPTLTGIASRIPEQRSWCEWLRQQLPAELAVHLVNVVPKEIAGAPTAIELVVLADSPAWSARLRYALAALQEQICARDGAVQRTRVRVSMG